MTPIEAAQGKTCLTAFVMLLACNSFANVPTAKQMRDIANKAELENCVEEIKKEANRGECSASIWSWHSSCRVTKEIKKKLKERGYRVTESSFPECTEYCDETRIDWCK